MSIRAPEGLSCSSEARTVDLDISWAELVFCEWAMKAARLARRKRRPVLSAYLHVISILAVNLTAKEPQRSENYI